MRTRAKSITAWRNRGGDLWTAGQTPRSPGTYGARGYAPATTRPVFGSTWVFAGTGAIATVNCPCSCPPEASCALALPERPAATVNLTVCEPGFTGITRQVKVCVRPEASGPRAQVLTYAVWPPPGTLTSWLCTGGLAIAPGPRSMAHTGRLFAESSG